MKDQFLDVQDKTLSIKFLEQIMFNYSNF